MEDAPMFARTGFTSPLGKLDTSFDGGRIESEILERFARRRRELTPKSGSEVLRDFIRVAALGKEQAVRMYGEGVLVVVQMIGEMSDDKETRS